MAYKKSQLEKQAIEAIKKHNLMFITDVPAYLPCATSTFYSKELEKSEAIKELLNKNRINVKNGLRAKWFKSDNPTVQIALYKLIGTDDEAHRLNGSKREVKHELDIDKSKLPEWMNEGKS